MSSKKPQPLYDRSPRNPCPVCGEISYSLGGIHPQCAVRREDSVRMSRLKDAAAGIVGPSNGDTDKVSIPSNDYRAEGSPWHKRCPECGTVVHARKSPCDCGHTFAVRAPVSDSEGSTN